MRYKIKGQVSIRNRGKNYVPDGPMEITKDYEETIEASSPEEAVELSLSGFEEEEEPTWEPGYTVTAIA